MSTTTPVFAAAEHAEQLIPAIQFQRYPANRIPSDEAINAMAQSIRENGQLQPITARPITRDGNETLEIIFGETRVLGCQAIDPQQPVRCYIIPMDDKTAARIHGVENFQRKDLDPIEEAHAIANMSENGWKKPEIAKHLGITRETVYARLSLLKLDGETLIAVREGIISLRTASEIAQLDPGDQEKAREICINPTHSSTHLSERDALRQIEIQITLPKKQAAEWEARREELEKAHPASSFLPFEEATAALAHSSPYQDCGERPAWSLQSPRAQAGDIEMPTWGELAAKHSAATYIALPEQWDSGRKPRILTLSEPLIDAEIALVDAGSTPAIDCPFRHPSQREQSKVEEERRKAIEEQKAEALRAEIKEALLTIARPGAVTAAAAERLCIEIYDANSYEFDFTGRNLPGFDTDDTENDEKAARAYLRQKAIRGFEALGILYVLSKIDLCPTSYAGRELGKLLIGTKALKEKDFPLLTETWKDQCAKQLAEDEARLAAQGQAEQEQ